MSSPEVEEQIAKAKALLSGAFEHALCDMDRNSEAEFVAQHLETLAFMVRRGSIRNFNWKWDKGTGVIDAAHAVVPDIPMQFIHMTVNLKDNCEEPEGG